MGKSVENSNFLTFGTSVLCYEPPYPSFNFPRGIIIIFFHIIERTYEEVDKNYIQAGTENSQRFQVFPSCSLIFMQ